MLKRIVAVAGAVAITVSTHAGQFTACTADINADLAVNVGDLLAVIASWGPCTAGTSGGYTMGAAGEGVPGVVVPPAPIFCPADIAPPGAPDSVVNVQDLLMVISQWGQCTPTPPAASDAYVVWCEDFSLGNYTRWTSPYNNDSNPCTISGFNSEHPMSPVLSHRSAITCAQSGVHRGYGGLRFQGENITPNFATPSTGGIDSVHGLVISFNVWLEVPYVFNSQDNGLWMSMMTATDDCSNAWHRVITLNIDHPSMRLRPTHVDAVQYVQNAPAFPLYQWARVTVYLNMYEGEMHVWQNGQKIVRAWFTRPSGQTCQYHFGLYASGANTNVVMYEDDLRIVKLLQPLGEFVSEPLVTSLPSPCASGP